MSLPKIELLDNQALKIKSKVVEVITAALKEQQDNYNHLNDVLVKDNRVFNKNLDKNDIINVFLMASNNLDGSDYIHKNKVAVVMVQIGALRQSKETTERYISGDELAINRINLLANFVYRVLESNKWNMLGGGCKIKSPLNVNYTMPLTDIVDKQTGYLGRADLSVEIEYTEEVMQIDESVPLDKNNFDFTNQDGGLETDNT